MENLNVLCNAKGFKITELKEKTDVDKFISKRVISVLCEDKISINKLTSHMSGVIEENNNNYEIYINYVLAKNVFKQSWLCDKIPFELFITALKIHELSHLRYTDFKVQLQNDNLLKALHDVLEDSMIEYQLSLEFPEYSQYIKFLIYAIHPRLDNKDLEKENELLKVVYNLSRFSLIESKKDIDFVNKILPYVVMSKRSGSTEQTKLASMMIHKITCDEADEDIKKQMQKQIDKSAGDKQKQEQLKSELDNKLKEKDKQRKESKEKQVALNQADVNKQNKQSDISKQVTVQIETTGSEKSAELTSQEKSGYFLTVIKKRQTEIEQLNRIFNSAFTEYKMINAYDGDMDIRKQQQAYLNSLINEESKDYQVRKIEKILLDVVLLRDISGSTSTFKEQYAEAVIVFLSALNNISGLRTSQIDFESTSKINKTFEKEIDISYINPTAMGGTSLIDSYESILKFDFKGKKNLVIVISDGDTSNKQRELELEAQIKKVAKIIKIAVGGYSNKDYIKVEIKDLPNFVMNKIINEELRN